MSSVAIHMQDETSVPLLKWIKNDPDEAAVKTMVPPPSSENLLKHKATGQLGGTLFSKQVYFLNPHTWFDLSVYCRLCLMLTNSSETHTTLFFHLHPALYASVSHRFILYITADVCCSSIFICRLKLLTLHWSKGLQLLLMRHLQRLPPSYCQPHLLDAYISSSPRTSRAVTIQGFGYIFLSHIYMPWFISDIITGSVYCFLEFGNAKLACLYSSYTKFWLFSL